MHRLTILILTLALALGCSAANNVSMEEQAQKQIQVIKDLQKSFVSVEFTLQKDAGDEPEAAGMYYRCPNCSRWHSMSVRGTLKEERPAEMAGYLIAPDRVILKDPVIHPRFIKKLEVRKGDQVVGASFSALPHTQYAMLLELDEPLKDVVALEFDANAEGPYYCAKHTLMDNEPTASLVPFAPGLVLRKGEEGMRTSEANGLIITGDGTPVGMVFTSEMPIDDSWKGSPEDWPLVEKSEFAMIKEAVLAEVQASIPRVELLFRSPSSEDDDYRYSRYSRYGGDASFDGTEANVPGMIWDSETLVVMADISPKDTARLEKIRVHMQDGSVVNATFKASLTDLPFLIAKPDQPFDKSLTLYQPELENLRHQMSIAATVKVMGESREIHLLPKRLVGFEKGMKGRFFPDLPRGDEAFLFTRDGELAIFPGGFREKPWDSSYYGGDEGPMDIAMLQEKLDDLEQYADAANVPLTEEEANRVAWLGVVLQSLNPELARANDVVLETKNGEIGALVNLVYPGSPAEEAGIAPGMILLSLQFADEPNPIEIEYQEMGGFGYGRMFPWERLDELPEEYFSDLPSPFPSVTNTFNAILTQYGVGKKYSLTVLKGGEKETMELTTQYSPPHYKSAKRTENKAVGINVRNMTFEIRRYVKLKENDPGVVISKIEPGSKAAVAGIKPYELLTQVNGEPIRNTEDFDKALSEPGEYKLTIKRMAKTRIVTLTLKEEDFKEKGDKEAQSEEE